MTYAGAAWAPVITKTAWKQIEAVQTIGLRSTSGTQIYFKNEILLNHQSRAQIIKETIRWQAILPHQTIPFLTPTKHSQRTNQFSKNQDSTPSTNHMGSKQQKLNK